MQVIKVWVQKLLGAVISKSASVVKPRKLNCQGSSLRGLGRSLTILNRRSHLFFKDFIYLLLEKGERREKGRKETLTCKRYIDGSLSYASIWRPGPQPGHVPWSGMKTAAFRFAGGHSIPWATPCPMSLASCFLKRSKIILYLFSYKDSWNYINLIPWRIWSILILRLSTENFVISKSQ